MSTRTSSLRSRVALAAAIIVGMIGLQYLAAPHVWNVALSSRSWFSSFPAGGLTRLAEPLSPLIALPLGPVISDAITNIGRSWAGRVASLVIPFRDLRSNYLSFALANSLLWGFLIGTALYLRRLRWQAVGIILIVLGMLFLADPVSWGLPGRFARLVINGSIVLLALCVALPRWQRLRALAVDEAVEWSEVRTWSWLEAAICGMTLAAFAVVAVFGVARQ